MKAWALFLAGSFAWAADSNTTIKGWVIDSACTFTKQLDKPISTECAVACARKGSPLVIQSDNGTIYLPVSEKMPSSSQNPRLIPFAGKRVVVIGKTYERSGAHAISIARVEAEK